MTAAEQAVELERLWGEGAVVALARPEERDALAKALPVDMEPLRHWGPAVLIGSGGSGGGRRWCLQPLEHLRQSAEATGAWLRAVGIDPAGTVLVNPLPLHHVSGLLPLVRSRLWGVPLHGLSAELMRQPGALAARVILPPDRRALLSLVPTQLQRLMADPAGVAWLRGFAVIWVGGSGLAPALAAAARVEGIRLSPATEPRKPRRWWRPCPRRRSSPAGRVAAMSWPMWSFALMPPAPLRCAQPASARAG